jgi:hypothetical protein
MSVRLKPLMSLQPSLLQILHTHYIIAQMIRILAVPAQPAAETHALSKDRPPQHLP